MDLLIKKNKKVSTKDTLSMPILETEELEENNIDIKSSLNSWNLNAQLLGLNNHITESIDKILSFKTNSPALQLSLNNLRFITIDQLKSLDVTNDSQTDSTLSKTAKHINNEESLPTQSYFQQFTNNTYDFVNGIAKSVYDTVSNTLNQIYKIFNDFFNPAKLDRIENVNNNSQLNNIEKFFELGHQVIKTSTEEKQLYNDLIAHIDSFFYLNKPYLTRNILDYEDPRDGLNNNQPKLLRK